MSSPLDGVRIISMAEQYPGPYCTLLLADMGADVILVEPVVQPDYTKSRQEAGEHGQTPANYRITRELLQTKAKSDAILLHSLPRMDEIPPDVDITRWSRYWQEAFNGVVIRMSLLALVLGAME